MRRSTAVSILCLALLTACAVDAPESECVPDCSGRTCGPDPICGASCGGCTFGTCVAGRCEGTDPCVPECSGRECGADPVCGASCGMCAGACDDGACLDTTGCTPTCSAAEECVSGTCVPRATDGICLETCAYSGDGECDDGGEGSDTALCVLGTDCTDCGPRGVPACSCGGRECGDDGCGTSCGSCDAGESCSAAGACVSGCVPSCVGAECGDDGCGGSCGSCSDGDVCTSGTCGRDCFFESQTYTFRASDVDWTETNVVSVRIRQRRGDGTWTDWSTMVFSDSSGMSRSFTGACEPHAEVERSYSMLGGVTCSFGPELVLRNDIAIPAATSSGSTCDAPPL